LIDTSFDLAVIDRLLMTTRAVRRRLDLTRPVDRGVIVECLQLACYAPTRSNTQAYRWVVVDDPDLRRRAGDIYRDYLEPRLSGRTPSDETQARLVRATLYLARHMAEVPVLVLPCYDLGDAAELYDRDDRGFDRLRKDHRQMNANYASLYPAVWSFMLACRSRGLGTAMTTAHTQEAVTEEAMRQLLKIPKTWIQSCLVPVAHTTGGDFTPPQRRPVEECIAWNGLT
jgi:nitroreductase